MNFFRSGLTTDDFKDLGKIPEFKEVFTIVKKSADTHLKTLFKKKVGTESIEEVEQLRFWTTSSRSSHWCKLCEKRSELNRRQSGRCRDGC